MTSPPAEPPSYVAFFRRFLALTNHYLDSRSRILDFGCGAGKFVYQFRDAGLDARGFDIHDYLELRSPDDRQFFDLVDNDISDTSIMSVDWDRYRLPYDDGTFDLVLSSQTLEHVLNLSELARVTKRDGINLHVFPLKYRFLEAHTFVPFGGMTKSFLYNLFWTTLGVRNTYQNGLSAVERAKLNARYARTGTNYLSIPEIRRVGCKHFEGVHFAPELWHAALGNYGWRLTRPALLAYTLLEEIVWVLERPRSAVHRRAPARS